METPENNRFGKVDYSIITKPEDELIWSYSYEDLQNKLNDVCKNHILKKVYADLHGYLESLHRDEKSCDFSFFGGSLLLIFDNIAVELIVHATGMVEYCTIMVEEIKIENRKGFTPDDMGINEDKYYYDLSNQFEVSYEDQKVINVSVDRTDCYSFSLYGFDEEKASLAEITNSLPNNIHFQLENGVDFGIYGDYIEYFSVTLTTI